jgi:hypothetical protein
MGHSPASGEGKADAAGEGARRERLQAAKKTLED